MRAVKFGVEPPRGVLMLGVQGSGKIIGGKGQVATAAGGGHFCGWMSGRLYDKFIGESERRLRRGVSGRRK